MPQGARTSLKILGGFVALTLLCFGLMALGSWGPCGPGSPWGYLAVLGVMLGLCGIAISALGILVLVLHGFVRRRRRDNL